jgi:YHS domain-containing protein
MKINTSLPSSLLGLAAILVFAPDLVAQPREAGTRSCAKCAKVSSQPAPGQLVKVTEKDAAWAAEARKQYPLDVCVTSDEKLGSMGDAAEFIYRVSGQPDRLVLFCCEACVEDFMSEPPKYLAKIDAAAKQPKTAKEEKQAGHHD